jgi:hypothetical protein
MTFYSTTYQYRDSDGVWQTADKSPEGLAADSDHIEMLKTNADFITNQRALRNILLKDCDWTQGEDIPDSIKLPYRTYRASLRDLPNHENWPILLQSDWPSKPEV